MAITKSYYFHIAVLANRTQFGLSFCALALLQSAEQASWCALQTGETLV